MLFLLPVPRYATLGPWQTDGSCKAYLQNEDGSPCSPGKISEVRTCLDGKIDACADFDPPGCCLRQVHCNLPDLSACPGKSHLVFY